MAESGTVVVVEASISPLLPPPGEGKAAAVRRRAEADGRGMDWIEEELSDRSVGGSVGSVALAFGINTKHTHGQKHQHTNTNAPFPPPGAAARWGGEPPLLLPPEEQGPSIIASPPLGDLLLLLPLLLLLLPPLCPTARGGGRALGACVRGGWRWEGGVNRSEAAGPFGDGSQHACPCPCPNACAPRHPQVITETDGRTDLPGLPPPRAIESTSRWSARPSPHPAAASSGVMRPPALGRVQVASWLADLAMDGPLPACGVGEMD